MVRAEVEDITDLVLLYLEFTTLGIGRNEMVECTFATSQGTAACPVSSSRVGSP